MPDASKIAEKNLSRIPDFVWTKNLPNALHDLSLMPGDELIGYYCNCHASLSDAIVLTKFGFFFPAGAAAFKEYKNILEFRFRDDFKKAEPQNRKFDVLMNNLERVELLVMASVSDLIYMHDFLRRCSIFSKKW